jgi:GWxTD domain-containing protein
MFKRKFASRLVATVLAFGFAVPYGFAQQGQGGQDVRSKPRNEKVELKKAYKDWIDRDVAYIITDEERKAFKKLATDDEREQFIEGFWRRRDPDPDTDENEYKEEYYERIAYANEHYASGIPGWKTDRGRMYIMFGKPDELESHPAGGSYQRESYEGGGSTSTYPFEKWFYRYIPGVGSGVEIEFVDPTGTGEYHIARSPNEKDALLMIPGAGLTLSEQLGMSDKADRVSGLAYNGPNGYMREQDNPFTKLQLLADLNRAPQIRFNELASSVNSPVIEDSSFNFDMRIDFFRLSDDRVVTAFTIQTDNKELAFQDVGGIQTARMNIFGKITSVAGRRIGTFEDPVITSASVNELADIKEKKSAYQKTFPLPAGRYKVDVIVRDVTSGAQQLKHLGFEVPKYDSTKLSASTLVLASVLRSISNQPAVGQFVIGQNKVIPNVSGVFQRGDSVGIYLQVYGAGIDQTTLRPSVDVQYVLSKDGKEIGKQGEDWTGLSDSSQRLTLARLLDSSKLAPGEYSIDVRIKDHVSGQTLNPSAKFTIDK